MEVARFAGFCSVLWLLAGPAWAIGWFGQDLNGLPCTGGEQGFGPYDYTNPRHVRSKLPIVEAYHFKPESEQLIRGVQGNLPGDFDYTLRAFPNHHRALFAMIRYATRPALEGGKQKPLLSAPECYLQRAQRFQPKDAKVHLLYGIYLHRLGRFSEAETLYRNAIDMEPNNAEMHYNLGLALADQERFEDAVVEARTAYKLGYPLQGLKRRLAAAGYPLEP